MKNKLSLLVLLSLLCVALLPLVSKADVPDVRPPIHPGEEEDDEVATINRFSSHVEIVFLENVEEAEVIVYAEDGTAVYHARRSTGVHRKVVIDAADWNGRYNVVLYSKNARQLEVVEYR